MDYFGRLATGIKAKWKNTLSGLRSYFKKLLFPVYLFPIKFVSYTIYYLVLLIIKIIVKLLKFTWYCIRWPFRKWANFFKTILSIVLFFYLLFSLMVIIDYLNRNYGGMSKFFCGQYSTKNKLQKSIVRVVGGYSEGSGFFIKDDVILTNFHVIADEPSPKIIFSDGKFITPYKIIGDKIADLAIIYVKEKQPDKVLDVMDPLAIRVDEPLISAGFALGTSIKGDPTILDGKFVAFRNSKSVPVDYLQTSINLVEGMSGGPLVDTCGKVVGINTAGLSGLSLFIDGASAIKKISSFTDTDVAKINVDPSKSPAEAVKAFYTYLKARKMEEGFKLLSKEYLKKTNFTEWTNRFTDILDVDVIGTEPAPGSPDLVNVKFATKNWVDGEVEIHYYEGVWRTIQEEGVYKMLRSNIAEIPEPGWDWFN